MIDSAPNLLLTFYPTSNDMSENPSYAHGHHESVLRSHAQRTAQNSAAYLLPYLEPHMRVLDVGCGPGTITTSLAALVPAGHVTGVDLVPADSAVLSGARARAEALGIRNATFEPGDAMNLGGSDGRYDVVHCHQVLQHLPGGGAVRALREMKRVARRGGVVAAREADAGTFVWWPPSEALSEWMRAYLGVARAGGGEPDAGRRLVGWALEAEFGRGAVEASVGAVCYSTGEERAWWGGMWADRTLESEFARRAVEAGVVGGREELEGMAEGWRKWAEEEAGWFALTQGQIVCRV